MTSDFEHQLLIQILRNSSWIEGDEKLNHIEYVAKHEYDIKRTGRVLAFLGLAEEDKQAPFDGYRRGPFRHYCEKRDATIKAKQQSKDC